MERGEGDKKVERLEEVVLDASVAVKWFTEEKSTKSALELRDSYFRGEINLLAPDLLLYEVSNALRYKKGVNANLLKEWVADIIDMQIDLISPNQHVLEKSLENAIEFGITFYDSCYLTLAELSGAQLVTADKDFYEKVKSSRGEVVLLS